MPSSAASVCGCCGIPLLTVGKQPPEGWSPPQGELDIATYREASVTRHNFYRQKHASPPLRHDEKLGISPNWFGPEANTSGLEGPALKKGLVIVMIMGPRFPFGTTLCSTSMTST
ncbi:unnamed protein product [Cyprideis torosa]|uniref:Uncharacterized protein n=1 Tax=Cyprideis torosa TaxID=163714 RepID=A0A7R8ZNJ3_9CRUS|nr:unnamed protein product [Cyprideis torosa]CAG0886490.1 unnamed protein product [Cyprideis torosa]